MFINVAAETVTEMTITFLLLSDKLCFEWIFEQSDFTVVKFVFISDLFVVAFFDVAGVAIVIIVVVVASFVVIVVDIFGVCVLFTNLVTGS